MRASAHGAGRRRRLSSKLPSKPLKPLAAVALLAAVAMGAVPGWSPVRILAGDTLWGLAQARGTTIAAIQRHNHLTGDTIYAGSTLLLPVSGPGPAAGAGAGSGDYLIRPGDTVSALAVRFGTTETAIARLNELGPGMEIFAGERLRIPGRAAGRPARTPARRHPAPPRRAPRRPARSRHAARPAPVRRRSRGGAALAAAIAADQALLDREQVPDFQQSWNLVRDTARSQGVPTNLALAVAFQESGMQQRVVSRTDAVGIMQVEPGTAAWLSRAAGRPIDRLYAGDNVYAGVLLLHLLLREAPLRQAIAGYYQGLGSVRSHGELASTRRYVADVLALAARFR